MADADVAMQACSHSAELCMVLALLSWVYGYALAPCRCNTQCLHVALAEVLHRYDYEPAQPEHTLRKFCQLSDDVAVVLQSWCDTGSVLPRPTLEAAKVGFRTLVPLFTYLPN